MLDVLEKIGKAFRLPGKITDFETITNGNINNTYLVVYRNGEITKKYVFQQINTYVFKDPVNMMVNIDKVTSHIRAKSPAKPCLHFYHTEERKNYVFDNDGSFWRVMNYIESVTFDISDDLKIISATGQAFGEFQLQVSDFDGSVLYETISDFHNTVKRLNTLFEHVSEDPKGRVAQAKEEIEYIASVREKAGELCKKYMSGAFPIRVTHNDTKSNNVLFHKETYEPLTVVDLDTVMPGMAMYDFGDSVRFICNTAVEDEPDLSKVSFDTVKFDAFCSGYMGVVKDALTKDEIQSMVLGTFSITIELAARFLDDYLTGDAYFKTLYPEHNLVRTRCQLCLAKDIMKKYDQLEEIVNKYC